MKNYLGTKTKKFQAGGPMTAPEGVEQGPAAGPEAEIQAMLQQVIETQDPQLALQVCNALFEMLSGGPATPQGAPAMPTPGAEQGVPMGQYGMNIK